MMNEMIERCSEVILNRSNDPDMMADCGLPIYDAEQIAKAVIKAMREPTEEMINAATTATGGCGMADYHYDYDVKLQWQAMIDAALKDD